MQYESDMCILLDVGRAELRLVTPIKRADVGSYILYHSLPIVRRCQLPSQASTVTLTTHVTTNRRG